MSKFSFLLSSNQFIWEVRPWTLIYINLYLLIDRNKNSDDSLSAKVETDKIFALSPKADYYLVW